ncbi:ABC transporter G family member 31, partial [Mucuna pruriens]
MVALMKAEYSEIGSIGSESFARVSNAKTLAEDEEELQWAALENSDVRFCTDLDNLTDVKKLSYSCREFVVKKALTTIDKDNFYLLFAIKKRLNKFRFPIIN